MAPTIFIVPGLYEGPGVFEPLVRALEADGFPVHTTKLISTGTTTPHNPTMDDDIVAISNDLSQIVDRAGPEGVVAVMHSAGGFLGSAAMQGLTATARKATGKEGGVRQAVFLAAGIGPEGMEHKPQPFMEFHEEKGHPSYQTCKDILNNLFHDLPPEEGQSWTAKMQHQPADWDRTITYCGWREMPSIYVVCQQDRLLPPPMQEHMATLAKSKMVSIDSGHMVQLSHTSEVAKIVKDAIAVGNV